MNQLDRISTSVPSFVHLIVMPIQLPTWALALIAIVATWLAVRTTLYTPPGPIMKHHKPGKEQGEPMFRQRLVAVGDLHGGTSFTLYSELR
jgi:hypothetical protein